MAQKLLAGTRRPALQEGFLREAFSPATAPAGDAKLPLASWPGFWAAGLGGALLVGHRLRVSGGVWTRERSVGL